MVARGTNNSMVGRRIRQNEALLWGLLILILMYLNFGDLMKSSKKSPILTHSPRTTVPQTETKRPVPEQTDSPPEQNSDPPPESPEPVSSDAPKERQSEAEYKARRREERNYGNPVDPISHNHAGRTHGEAVEYLQAYSSDPEPTCRPIDDLYQNVLMVAGYERFVMPLIRMYTADSQGTVGEVGPISLHPLVALMHAASAKRLYSFVFHNQVGHDETRSFVHKVYRQCSFESSVSHSEEELREHIYDVLVIGSLHSADALVDDLKSLTLIAKVVIVLDGAKQHNSPSGSFRRVRGLKDADLFIEELFLDDLGVGVFRLNPSADERVAAAANLIRQRRRHRRASSETPQPPSLTLQPSTIPPTRSPKRITVDTKPMDDFPKEGLHFDDPAREVEWTRLKRLYERSARLHDEQGVHRYGQQLTDLEETYGERRRPPAAKPTLVESEDTDNRPQVRENPRRGNAPSEPVTPSPDDLAEVDETPRQRKPLRRGSRRELQQLNDHETIMARRGPSASCLSFFADCEKCATDLLCGSDAVDEGMDYSFIDARHAAQFFNVIRNKDLPGHTLLAMVFYQALTVRRLPAMDRGTQAPLTVLGCYPSLAGLIATTVQEEYQRLVVQAHEPELCPISRVLGRSFADIGSQMTIEKKTDRIVHRSHLIVTTTRFLSANPGITAHIDFPCKLLVFGTAKAALERGGSRFHGPRGSAISMDFSSDNVGLIVYEFQQSRKRRARRAEEN